MINRELTFLGLCIPSRLLLGYLSKVSIETERNWLKYLLIVLFLSFSIGFLTIYMNDWRKTGLETNGEPIWWNFMRPLHGIMYGIAGVMLILNNIVSTNFKVLLIILTVAIIKKTYILWDFIPTILQTERTKSFY